MLFYGHVRYAVTVSAAVATRSRADCSSMEGHIPCTHLYERRGSVVVSTSAWHAAGRWFDSRTRHVSLLSVKTWLSTGKFVYL